MKIAVDIREACAVERTGKGQWSRFFVSELIRREIPLRLYTDAPAPEDWTTASHVEIVRLQTSGFRWHREVARLLPLSGADLYLSPTSYIVPFLLGTRFPVVPVVHDLIAFQREPHDRKAKLIERCTLGRAVRAASFICTISESTKSDLLLRFPSLAPEQVLPVFAGPVASGDIMSEPDLHTILCIGTLCPRKNQLRLIQAFSRLPESLRTQSRLILIGGRGWHDAEIVRLADKTPGVEWKGYSSQQECDALLARATVFAFPSLYEGFGMPVLDALCRGVPVLTSDRGSLREVTGDSARMVDPEDVSSIATGLADLLSNSALRATLAAKGKVQAAHFRWERSVDLFLERLSVIGIH